MKITFVISHLPNPRMNKRIDLLKKIGDVSLVYWNKQTLDIWDIFHKDINNIEINVKANYTNPLKRIKPTFKFLLKAINEIKKINPQILYVANIDMLFIAYLYKKISRNNIKIIYEIADINKLIADSPSSKIRKIFRQFLIKFESYLVKNISLLIVTSEKFYQEYFCEFVDKEKVVFMPNMPNTKLLHSYIKKNHEDPREFTIGFIGAIRYKQQMKMLINAANNTNTKLIFAGAGLDDEIENIAKNYSNISFLGKYSYEKDIANLYGMIDCVYAVYDADLTNVRLALPNKLYEAIYCEIPIIVSENTYLQEVVESLNVGVGTSHTNPSKLEELIVKLKNDKEYYNEFVKSCKKNKDMINIDLYNKVLLNKISKLTNERQVG